MTEIAEAQRARNARWITATLAVLSVLAALQTLVFEGKSQTVWLTGGCGALIGGGYVMVRRGHVAAGILVSCVCLLVQHVGVVAIEGELGPVPYLVSVALLLVAASAPGRWLPLAFVLTLLALALEAALSPWSRADQIATMTSILFTTIVFVVSLLHVRGTERAFELAEQQNRARSEAAATAMASEERYRWIADHADDLIGLVTDRGRAVYLSPSHERLLGVPAGGAGLGGRLHRAVRIQNLREAIAAFVATLELGEGRIELRVQARNGEQRILDSMLKRVKSPEGTLVTLISRDITERRRLEQQVLSAQRMEALGRLAGSVAHDFNNLLTVITSATELVRRALPSSHRSVADLDAILTATQTATSLTYQLLTFSKKQLVVKSPLDLVSALQEQRQLLARMVGSRIELEFDFSEGLPKVLMPAAHLDQLAMNFAINARDAMPDGGRLSFTLRERRLPASESEPLPPGHYIELAVADEGSGIPEDHFPHLFDPFFTTKGKEGTGLGLATCMSIATQAGGAIRVQSQMAVGTTFRVLLPASRGDQSPPSSARLPKRANRVLVVDDERAIRMMIARMLQAAGHDVQLASTLQGAQRLISDLQSPLDVVITDVVLSSDRGTDLLALCRQYRPGLRIVVMSGYAPDPRGSELLVLHGARFLPKPFTRVQLLEAIS